MIGLSCTATGPNSRVGERLAFLVITINSSQFPGLWTLREMPQSSQQQRQNETSTHHPDSICKLRTRCERACAFLRTTQTSGKMISRNLKPISRRANTTHSKKSMPDQVTQILTQQTNLSHP